MDFTIRYLRDEEVDDDLDRQLRALLLKCFPHNAHHLETKRWFRENPQNRWFAFDENGVLAAHIAAHEKIIGAGDKDLKVLGIAEVSVAPQFRGQRLVKIILEQVHQWGKEREFEFAVLAGMHQVYSSSGYVNAENLISAIDVETGQNITEKRSHFMYRPLDNQVWPDSKIDVRGPMF